MQVTVVAPEAQSPLQAAHSGREDLSSIPAGTSRLPASLLSKLSVVSLHDSTGSPDESRDTKPGAIRQDLAKSNAVSKRPLIEELER